MRAPGLASRLLGQMTRRLSRDWQARYLHPVHLVETSVERDRFGAASYRAAGWIGVGATTGRRRPGARRGHHPPGRSHQAGLQDRRPQTLAPTECRALSFRDRDAAG